ncbi:MULTISPECIES: hypothetical protein [unclassified Tolypothrix]|nr:MULTISPECIES: hypothetical protein [unclassified Tolypothrix]
MGTGDWGLGTGDWGLGTRKIREYGERGNNQLQTPKTKHQTPNA